MVVKGRAISTVPTVMSILALVMTPFDALHRPPSKVPTGVEATPLSSLGLHGCRFRSGVEDFGVQGLRASARLRGQAFSVLSS